MAHEVWRTEIQLHHARSEIQIDFTVFSTQFPSVFNLG